MRLLRHDDRLALPAPDGPLMNAGSGKQLPACFVLPVGGSIENFRRRKIRRHDPKSGGGTGFSFPSAVEELRVGVTGGVASGPVSLSHLQHLQADQTGRHPAQREHGHLRIDHPDILEFIQAQKSRRNSLLIVGVQKPSCRPWSRIGIALVSPASGKEQGRLQRPQKYSACWWTRRGKASASSSPAGSTAASPSSAGQHQPPAAGNPCCPIGLQPQLL